MAVQIQINIDTNASRSPQATFNPGAVSARARDQIFWTNNDSEPHWPGLVKDDGTINTTFFMLNQIAPNGDTSSSFSPTVANSVFEYACSIHPDERGVINVT
ncbi:MAG TPA: hypothetical protein VE974_23060 [Thermoanaerobaculia bacterium]|nr:hypothetical protein [Thermoanaerobaculia bacterium]